LTELLKQKNALSSVGAKLEDGIPELQQNLTLSPPSVPSEKEHASCDRTVMDLPFITSITVDVLSAPNTVWRKAHTKETDGRKFLLYSSEDDIVYFVRRFLEDILLALDLPLDFNGEVTIKQIRPDLCVLLKGMYLVGVVEVKKPGCNVLLEPTVLGELLDQMLLVEGFYGMGPVIGILTTAEEWIVSWFPVDSDNLARHNVDLPEDSFSTPVKQNSSTCTETEGTKGDSPIGGTPSQKSGMLHSIETDADDKLALDNDNAAIISQEMARSLCTTEVLNIYTDPTRVVQHLCCAFQVMSKAHLHHRSNLPRCLLKFHKESNAVTFHPASYEDVYLMVDFDKFPSKNIKTLVALEDLGRGSTGKAWLCVTVTKPRSASCVLKFDNKHTNSRNLVSERNMWNLLYPEFSCMIKLEQWSGADALVMPHFSTVLENERERYKDELWEVLTSKFMENGKVHRDVRWRNIGKYRNKGGNVSLVVFDLHDVVDYDVDAHKDWIGNAMKTLFVDV
jgi:hypothetical protein